MFASMVAGDPLARAGALFEMASTDSITHEPFGRTPDGTAVERYTLRNAHGMAVSIITFGGIITSIEVPDRSGKFSDVVLGFDSLAGYLDNPPYFGALIGRCANRIAQGRFTLDGRNYRLAINSGPNSLHGGTVGFNRVVWSVRHAALTPQGPQLTLTYLSRDGEEGYPGNLQVTATYTLEADDALRLRLGAETDRATLVNLTQHTYFNLRGRRDILGHRVRIPASRFTPVDEALIPTGELQSVEGTPFDFRAPTAIGARINAADEQLRRAGGYDHNWVLALKRGPLQTVATVEEPDTGRVLEVQSTEPGLQFYSGNFLNGSITGKSGVAYGRRDGLCLEPQHFPDAPNHPGFASIVLRPGQTYQSTIVYRFTTRPD
jgi:aldose 1-epimerase